MINTTIIHSNKSFPQFRKTWMSHHWRSHLKYAWVAYSLPNRMLRLWRWWQCLVLLLIRHRTLSSTKKVARRLKFTSCSSITHFFDTSKQKHVLEHRYPIASKWPSTATYECREITTYFRNARKRPPTMRSGLVGSMRFELPKAERSAPPKLALYTLSLV